MKGTNLRPLHDRIIILQDAKEEITEGGIIVPDTVKDKPRQGVVIAAGPGKKDSPMEAKPGDLILFAQFSGTEITNPVDGIQYLVMREEEILTTYGHKELE